MSPQGSVQGSPSTLHIMPRLEIRMPVLGGTTIDLDAQADLDLILDTQADPDLGLDVQADTLNPLPSPPSPMDSLRAP